MYQEEIRERAKMLKWKYNIGYKFVAEEILHMHYNSYLNFVNGYTTLGKQRAEILSKYIRQIERHK